MDKQTVADKFHEAKAARNECNRIAADKLSEALGDVKEALEMFHTPSEDDFAIANKGITAMYQLIANARNPHWGA